MTLAKETVHADIEYTAWATRLLLDACAELTPEQLTRDIGISHRSIIDTLQHNFEGERTWTDSLVASALPSPESLVNPQVRDRSSNLAALERDWPPVWESLLAWSEGVTDEELSSEISDGATFHLPRWQVLRHLVNHSTLHRGQVIGMLRMLGKQPPQTDIITFYCLK